MNILVLLLLIINDYDGVVAAADDDVKDEQYIIFSIKYLFTKNCNGILSKKLAKKKKKKRKKRNPAFSSLFPREGYFFHVVRCFTVY